MTTRGRRSGFTLLEMMITLVVVALIFGNIAMVMRSSQSAYQQQSSTSDLDIQADQTLDHVALALMSARLQSLDPTANAPAYHSSLQFVQSLGVENGQVVVSDPERVEMVVDQGKVVWKQRPDQLDERMIVWSRWVSDFLEGEIPNGIDDNGNGLVDEKGLAFVIVGSQVTIHLTLERTEPGGKTILQSRSTVVACRN
jgi:prepilin-type N-terminal cleavage/methylation domain-containing protein